MNSGLYRLLVALLFLLSCGAGFWLYENFTIVATSTDVGFQGAAREDPLLAAQRFLTSPGAPARSEATLDRLPPGGVLVLSGSRHGLGRQWTADLLAWVRKGGRLIAVADDASVSGSPSPPDYLLKAVGVHLAATHRKGMCSTGPVTIAWPTVPHSLRVGFLSGRTLVSRGPRPEFALSANGEVHLLRYAIGKGTLTILSDAGFMENGAIGKYDNAAFLWYLTHSGRQRPIWLVYSSRVAPLWLWLWHNAWPVVIGIAMLIAAWLWSGFRRLGPARASPSLARRRLLDHIRASGQFLWRHGAQKTLLEASRAAAVRELETRHPTIAALQPEAQIERVTERLSAPPEAIRQALFASDAHDEYQFTAMIRLLEQIRTLS